MQTSAFVRFLRSTHDLTRNLENPHTHAGGPLECNCRVEKRIIVDYSEAWASCWISFLQDSSFWCQSCSLSITHRSQSHSQIKSVLTQPGMSYYHLERILTPSTSNSTVTTADQDDDSNFDPRIFWGVNACFLIAVVVTCCYCYHNRNCITQAHERRRQTDLEFQRNQLERRERKRKAKEISPEKLRRLLLSSFKKHRVMMVSFPWDWDGLPGQRVAFPVFWSLVASLTVFFRFLLWKDCERRRLCCRSRSLGIRWWGDSRWW